MSKSNTPNTQSIAQSTEPTIKPTKPTIHSHSLEAIRHYLHQYPELSGQETETADYIAEQLQSLAPDQLIRGLGGTGVAAIFDSGKAGKTLLFRCELDALPIQSIHDKPYRSTRAGIAHQCGHDGHMAIILGLAQAIANSRPKRGRVVILFQPAEETGEGARAVVNDPQFSQIAPDESFALHNLPQQPLGEVIIRAGTFNCASRGLLIRLKGRTAHAAYPETGISPQLALAELLQAFSELPEQLKQEQSENEHGLIMVTVVHCDMGEATFGTSPADACLMVTLRTETDAAMQLLADASVALVNATATKYHLQSRVEWSDIFDASVNDEGCVKQVIDAAETHGHHVRVIDKPFRWSEDFGAISAVSRGAMFAFGAGEDCPQIHNPDYVFADELITQGRDIFFEIYRQLL